MTHGSLFSGIGGFDLAAEWAGWENSFHCEWNPFGQRVLKYYWPNAESFTDITKSDFTPYANKIDVLTGGFPCQPYSTAGKQLGKEDDRHLWPEMLRAIRAIQPRWVVGENVRGIINWNGGLVFEEVQIDLENEGYEVTSFLLPACAINAQHRRDRIWFIGYLPNPSCIRQNWIDKPKDGYKCKRGGEAQRVIKSLYRTGDRFHRKDGSPITRNTNGLSKRLDGITLDAWEEESIKAFGNAIVPQVAYQIFKAINEYEKL